MSAVLPNRGSRNTHIETVVYETDRNNGPGVELPGITNVEVDWDIDRSGSKSRIDIATHQRVLKDGMWVAPYLRITPEVGEIQYQQMGHYRLGLPSTITDGSVDTWGDDKVIQEATGGDIVDVLADASLPHTFYTPRNGNVLADVEVLIRMATSGMLGPNLLTNGSFENNGDGWTIAGGSASTSYNVDAGRNPADGEKVWRSFFSAGLPVLAQAYAIQEVSIPPGTRFMYASGLSYWWRQGLDLYLQLRFYNSTGSEIPNTRRSSPRQRTRLWRRHFIVAEVPLEAASMRVYVFKVINQGGGDYTVGYWDDIRVGTCTAMPIPDSRINLPQSDARASTRIQTTAGNSIGYEAINADRLAAIGHHALYTDLTGRLTTTPSRDLGSATVARTYREGDYRFVGATEVQRSANNRYNTVTAVKESFEEGVPPMFVTVWNDDPDDPWSVHHLGNVRYSNGPLMVQDAVDTDALESAALATLARATMQHTLRITVLPDPSLAVHDVIEIIGGPEEARGRWLVEYLRPGLMASDPVVEIGARRTLSSAGVSGVDMGGG